MYCKAARITIHLRCDLVSFFAFHLYLFQNQFLFSIQFIILYVFHCIYSSFFKKKTFDRDCSNASMWAHEEKKIIIKAK